MNTSLSCFRSASRLFTSIPATAAFAALVLFAGVIPATAQAQMGPSGPGGPGGPGRGFGPGGRDLRVEVDPHGGPRFFAGPGRDEFHFVREVPAGRFIDSRDVLLGLLLRPAVDAVAWGLGEVTTVAVADALGVPVHTTLYGVEPTTVVYSTLPPGYFVAESIPANVALVRYTPAGPVVVVRRVPPGAFVAYQTSSTGVVLNECLVVPPVQQVVLAAPVAMPVPTSPAPAVAPAAPAPAATAAPAVPMAAGKMSHIVYDANGKPSGVIVLDADGKQEYVPLGP